MITYLLLMIRKKNVIYILCTYNSGGKKSWEEKLDPEYNTKASEKHSVQPTEAPGVPRKMMAKSSESCFVAPKRFLCPEKIPDHFPANNEYFYTEISLYYILRITD